MTTIVPLNQLQRRAPEAGRIRTGIKAGRAMKALDTFRFTSPHDQAIRALAAAYGGEARPWDEPTANKGQWEVITEARSIEVLIQPGGLSTFYELWSGGGCARRCDGLICEVPSRDPNEAYDSVSCICDAKGIAECNPHTRLQVVLPDIDFYGVWRLESKGWNAAKELPGMFDMIVALAEGGKMVRAFLHLEQRTSKVKGKTQHYIVPTLSLAATPNELLSGGGVARPQITAGRTEPLRAIGAADAVEEDHPVEIVEAVVMMDEETEAELEASVRDIAIDHSLDADAVVATLWDMTDANEDKIRSFIRKAAGGKRLSFTGNGGLKWTTT
jgi:hypothetical protein